jgi:hypothetical protein
MVDVYRIVAQTNKGGGFSLRPIEYPRRHYAGPGKQKKAKDARAAARTQALVRKVPGLVRNLKGLFRATE